MTSDCNSGKHVLTQRYRDTAAMYDSACVDWGKIFGYTKLIVLYL